MRGCQHDVRHHSAGGRIPNGFTAQRSRTILRPHRQKRNPSPPSHRTQVRDRHEIPLSQLRAFRSEHKFDRTRAREEDSPANNNTWYDAAAYCNWLSKEEGIPPEEWCQDAALLYDTDLARMGDKEQAGKLSNSQSRVLRGGSFAYGAADVRSSNRSVIQPDSRNGSSGFRVARTYP